MKKSTRKFAVINRQRSNDKFILPMNANALKHMMSLDGAETEDFCLDMFTIGYNSSDTYKSILRMANTTRWSDVYTVRNRENYEYFSNFRYMRLIDTDVKITTRFFDHMISYTNLKWIEEDNKQFILVDESMIPEGMTESFVRKNKLVSKDDTQEIYGDASIMSYHYSQWHPEVEKQFTKLMDKTEGAVNFGFEAEKVHEELAENGIAMRLAHETGYKKEYDGSLGSEGFELISPILPLFNQQVIDESIAPVTELLNADTNDRCGGHFNISKNGFKSRDILKAVKGSVPLLYMIYEKRMTNRFCEAKNFSTYLRSPRKYSACYLKNDNILEIRLFPAIKNTSILQNRIELMRMIMGELYGKSSMKVLIELSNPTTNLHSFVLNRLLNGNRNKLVNKIKMFVNLSERYGCGKISLPTKKKINKLMQEQIFDIPVPVEAVSVETTNEVIPLIQEDNVINDTPIEYAQVDVNDAYESHQSAYYNSTDYLYNSAGEDIRESFVAADYMIRNWPVELSSNRMFCQILDATISTESETIPVSTSERFQDIVNGFNSRCNNSNSILDENVSVIDMRTSMKTFFIANYFLSHRDASNMGVKIKGYVRNSYSNVFYYMHRENNGDVIGVFGVENMGIQWMIEKRTGENFYRLTKQPNIAIIVNDVYEMLFLDCLVWFFYKKCTHMFLIFGLECEGTN